MTIFEHYGAGATLAQVYSVQGGAYGGFEGRDIVTTQRQRYELIMDHNRNAWEFADEGGVIVGRNSTVILADRPGTVHVLLTGTSEDRAARAAKEAGISVERAEARQKREDQVRADMSIMLYGWDPRLADRYDGGLVGVFALASILVMFFYPLTEAKFREISAEIAARRASRP